MAVKTKGMNFYIHEHVEGVTFNAHVALLDETYKYFQITPDAGFPFFIRFDRSTKKWRAVAEIYKTDPKIIEVIGRLINNEWQNFAA